MAIDDRVARSVALEQAYVYDVYEEFNDNPKSKPWAKVERFLDDLEPGSLICDVGCGSGKYLKLGTDLYTIGGDRSMKMTELAREKQNEVMLLDNLALPYRDESLDAVLSIAVIHHLATTERRICALKELARVLRIGGRLIISVWAMEQSHRKFESQDVLVPWHKPKHCNTASLEQLTSTTTTTNTSEDDCVPPYHAYTQTSDSDSNRSLNKLKILGRRRGRTRPKDRTNDPAFPVSSPSSSSLSSPNETCYSFVRRALQKLAGGRRVGVHKPWFLESWGACTKEPTPRRREHACDCCECTENVHDLPIELRRIDDDTDLSQQRRQTFPSSQLINDITTNLKSKSMTDIKTVESVSKIVEIPLDGNRITHHHPVKPRLVKQKKSVCDEDDVDENEALDRPSDMRSLVKNLPDFNVITSGKNERVLKQQSLNEDLMSGERLREKEILKQNIQKQTSLNEELIYQRNNTLKDSFFSTSKRFQLIKTGFTNKIKNSTTNIERVTGSTLKNGFVRMFQNWKSPDATTTPTTIDESLESPKKLNDEKREVTNERRPSKEDGSDSSKDSSLQSDTSVDSEDSFASVIFIPKSDPMSPAQLSPGPSTHNTKLQQNLTNPPRIKQSSCPTSPRIKQMPLAIYPLTKQLSSPKPSSSTTTYDLDRDHHRASNVSPKTLAQKYSVPQIPAFKRTNINTPPINNNNHTNKSPADVSPPESTTRNERLKKIKELLIQQKPGFGTRHSRGSTFPIVRHSSVTNGKVEAIAKPLPKLLSLELFNPETDDKDSDSSCVSSPDSVDSVISVNSNRFRFPPGSDEKKNSLLQAAAQVANTLDQAVDRVIRSSPRSKRKLQTDEVMQIIRRYSNDKPMSPIKPPQPPSPAAPKDEWNDEECHKHLTNFADALSEKLLAEIDQYQVQKNRDTLSASSLENIDDPYISRLSEELDDLSKLSAEIQKQNEYLAKLSASDSLYENCTKCGDDCKCYPKTKTKKNVKKSSTNDSLTVTKIRMGASTDSCDSERGSSTNSMLSSVTTSLNFGQSQESTDGFSGDSQKDTSSIGRYSDGGGSTASLASCPDWKIIRNKDVSSLSLSSGRNNHILTGKSLLSDTSQDSLPSDNVGGEITYHRYYHVFREGELDQLIEKYVENLHVISSYYDHASWCIVAEKVQVWTI